MPDADLVTIAEAVKTMLNAATLSQTATAVRAWERIEELKDLNTIHVTIPVGDVEGRMIGRDTEQHDYTVPIVVQKKPASITTAALDALAYYVQEIRDLFLGKVITGTTWRCIGYTWSPIDYDKLEELRQFEAVLELTVRSMA